MKIFFGKIKPNANNQQINEAYYETFSPAKLGELQLGDYAFIISGNQVHLWKAKDRVDIDGHPKMVFDVILKNLPLSSQKFIAFKYFRLDSSLMVLTVRQSPKAFYPIQVVGSKLTEGMLTNIETYKDEQNFRKILITPTPGVLDANSPDIQLYFKDGQLHIQQSAFFDAELFPHFIDNLNKLGRGRREKDKALAKVKAGATAPTVYTYSQLPILRMYDALFNPYGDQEVPITDSNDDDDEKFTVSDADASLELSSFNQIYYGPPGTGKTYQVLKSFCIEEETMLAKKQQRIKLDMNSNFWHLAPGRHGYLWNDLQKGDVLGYEWSGKDWGDLKQLSPKHVEDEDGGSYQLISYLREVEEGDYICVISGRKFLGIAEVTDSYNFAQAIENPFKFQTVPVKWLKKFEKPLYLNASQTKTFVRLNNGKRWTSLLAILRENGFYFHDDEIAENKVTKPKNYTFITFHQSFSYEDFIQGIKPVLPESEDEQTSGKLQYEMVPGIFYLACDRAAQLAGYKDLQDCLGDSKKNRQKKFRKDNLLEYYLIIDEFNRGNVAAIFGELITLIEDDKRLGTDEEIVLELPYSKTPFGVPFNLRVIGTMNTADRSIEALDTAFRRRFSFQEILPEPNELRFEVDGLDINLRSLLTTINTRVEKLLSRDHTIGHAYLIKVNNLEGLKQAFANKIIPLLQEYFYGDYGKVGLVLGESFLEIKTERAIFKKVKNYDAGDLEERTIYALKDLQKMSSDDFIKAAKAIYEN